MLKLPIGNSQCACAFVNQIGRLPLPVKSSPGFLINRVLMPYLLECVQLLEEGYSREEIDAGSKVFWYDDGAC